MTSTQTAAQQLAIAVARLRIAERDARQAIARIGDQLAATRTQYQIQP